MDFFLAHPLKRRRLATSGRAFHIGDPSKTRTSGGSGIHVWNQYTLGTLGFWGIVPQGCLRHKLLWDEKLGYIRYELCGHDSVGVFFIRPFWGRVSLEIVLKNTAWGAKTNAPTAERSIRFSMQRCMASKFWRRIRNLQLAVMILLCMRSKTR